MSIYYVTNKKPLSHNKNGSKSKYKDEFRNEFMSKYAKLYDGLPLKDSKLQSNLVYIHRLKPGTIPDVDNLSKPIVDTFSGIIYKDDSQIIKRSALILKFEEYDFVTVDATNIPSVIFDDFNTYLDSKAENILLFEVDKVVLDKIKIGEI